MPSISLLIMPVSSSCNMKCVYCQHNSNSQKYTGKNFGAMPLKTAEAIVKKAFLYGGEQASFTFCGGEPMLWGLENFKAFVGYVNDYNTNGLSVSFSINTNGTLIDDAWADFLLRNGFSVKISLDGYKEINDLNRLDTKGGGTFNAVRKGMDTLRRHGISFGVSCVVNRLTAKYVDKIYNFYKKNGLHSLYFIPCMDSSPDKRGKSFYSLTPELYEGFLKELFDKWYEDLMKNGDISIKHFDNWVAMMFGYPADSCYINGVCASQLVVESDGGVYPCEHFINEKWRLGSILKMDFDELFASEKAKLFLNQSFHIDGKCNKCKYFKICRGGCRCDREPMHDDSLSLNYYCQAYERFFAYAFERLRKIAVLLNTNKLI